MSATQALLLYAAGVIVASMLGGSIPLWSQPSLRRLNIYLAASAGIVLGVLGGHLLPEAFKAGPRAAWAIVGGFVFMLVVERFVLPHALHSPRHAAAHAECDPAVEQEHVRADAAGIGAFLGLSLHTLADGIAMGAAVENPSIAPYVFLAIVAHKVPSSFALGTLLVRARVRTARVLGAAAALGSMVGIGGFLFFAAQARGGFDPTRATAYAVAFSAGSFLHVALTDLLPDLHPEGTERRDILIALIGGLAAMVTLTLLLRD